MAILEKTFNAVNDLDNNLSAALEAFQAAKAEISHFTSPLYEEKLGAAKKLYEAVEQEQKKKALEAVKADFADTRSKFNAFTTAAVPDDFPTTIEAMKTMVEHISETESRAFIEKYKGNYLAIHAILDVLHYANKVPEIGACNSVELEGEVAELEGLVIDCILSFKGSTIMSALLTDPKQSLILKTGRKIQEFLDGGYVLYATKMKSLGN